MFHGLSPDSLHSAAHPASRFTAFLLLPNLHRAAHLASTLTVTLLFPIQPALCFIIFLLPPNLQSAAHSAIQLQLSLPPSHFQYIQIHVSSSFSCLQARKEQRIQLQLSLPAHPASSITAFSHLQTYRMQCIQHHFAASFQLPSLQCSTLCIRLPCPPPTPSAIARTRSNIQVAQLLMPQNLVQTGMCRNQQQPQKGTANDPHLL